MDSKGNCVAVQLASLLNMPLDKVENQIDHIWKVLPEPEKRQYDIDGEPKTWRELGVTAKMITNFGLNNGMNVHIMSGGRKIAQFKHDKGRKNCASALLSRPTTLGFTALKASKEVYRTKPCQTTRHF